MPAAIYLWVVPGWLKGQQMDGQGVMRPQSSVVDRCSYTAGSDMHVNLAAVHFGMRLAVLASSLYRAFRLCLGYHCTVVLPIINLQ